MDEKPRKQYPFGYEAMKPILEALGLPIDDDVKNYVYQHMEIEFAHRQFPIIRIQIAPDSDFWNSEPVKETLAGMQVAIYGGEVMPEEKERWMLESLQSIVRGEIYSTLREIFREGGNPATGATRTSEG